MDWIRVGDIRRSRLKVLTNDSVMRFDCGLRTGVKHRTRPSQVAKSIVSDPLNRMQHSSGPKALLDTLEHLIADHLTGEAACAGTPSHDFSIYATVSGSNRGRSNRRIPSSLSGLADR